MLGLRREVGLDSPVDLVAGQALGSSGWLPGEFALGGQVWNYGYTGGGYVYGTNISTNEINHCAQGYLNLGAASFGVEGILVAFIGKDYAGTSTGTSSMTFNLYTMSANQAYGMSSSAWAKDEVGPNPTVLGSATMLLSAADTTFFTAVYAPLTGGTKGITATDFAVSVDATAIKAASDTVGIACDADGEGFRLAYHYVPAQTAWYVTDDLFGGLNNNIAIFPVIDDNFLGVNDVEFLNNMQLSAFPNPALTQTTISYNLNEDMKNVKLSVLDMTGKEVYNSAKGNQVKGSYNVTLDVSNFSAGNYFYTLTGNGNRMTKRMVVIK